MERRHAEPYGTAIPRGAMRGAALLAALLAAFLCADTLRAEPRFRQSSGRAGGGRAQSAAQNPLRNPPAARRAAFVWDGTEVHLAGAEEELPPAISMHDLPASQSEDYVEHIELPAAAGETPPDVEIVPSLQAVRSASQAARAGAAGDGANARRAPATAHRQVSQPGSIIRIEAPRTQPILLAQEPELIRPRNGQNDAAAPLPASRNRDPFGADQHRLPALGNSDRLIGGTPRPSAETREEYNRFVTQRIDPENVLDLVVGRPTVLIFSEPPIRLQLPDDEVAQFQLIEPTELSVTGTQVGTTVLNIWFGDREDPAQQRILSYLVRVLPDPEAKDRLEFVYAALEKEINRAFPESFVRLSLLGDKVVIRGQAKDIVEAAQILRVVSANAPGGQRVNQGGPGGGGAENIPYDPFGGVLLPPSAFLGPLREGIQEDILYDIRNNRSVINLLKVPGEQQVMLRVTVAEVNRSAARSIGLNFSLTNDEGLVVFQNLTGGLLSGGANLPTLLDNGQVQLAIRALRTLNLARSLAEPNLVTLNGQPASFQAGGSFPVTTSVGSVATVAQTVEFIPFGVNLSFTPFITDRDRIRLSLQGQVSSRSEATVDVGGSQVPQNLDQRTFQTTVELREGQTLAIAGLLSNTYGADSDRVPIWGDLPIIGNTGSFNRTTADEQELVVLITPELVHPLEACDTPGIPGDDLFEPSDVEFYLLGRMESRRSADFRSPARTDHARLKSYHDCEDAFIIGKQGAAYGCCGDPAGRCSAAMFLPRDVEGLPAPSRDPSRLEHPRGMPPGFLEDTDAEAEELPAGEMPEQDLPQSALETQP